MQPLVGPYLMGVLLLIAAGAAKIASPAPTQRAIRAGGLPAPSVAVVGLGIIEIAIAVWALAIGGRAPAVAVGILYLGFAAFVVRLLAAGGGDCGCFGASAAPLSPLHVVLDVALAAAAFGVATGPVPSIDGLEGPWSGWPLVGLIVLGAYLLYVTMTVLPETLNADRTARVTTFQIAGAIDREESRT